MRRVFDQLSHLVVGQSGMRDYGCGEAEPRLIELVYSVGFGSEPAEHSHELLLVQVTELEPKHDFPRHDVVCSRLYLDPPYRADLRARYAHDDLIHLVDEAGRRKQGVMALPHRCRARVVGEAL